MDRDVLYALVYKEVLTKKSTFNVIPQHIILMYRLIVLLDDLQQGTNTHWPQLHLNTATAQSTSNIATTGMVTSI